MNKKDKRFIFIALTVITITVIILAMALLAGKAKAPSHVVDNTVSGTVTEVTDKPNRAEDGYYGFTIKLADGLQAQLDATGYLNTPMSPEDQHEKCVSVPKVAVGDTVEFNLPVVFGIAGPMYSICYPEDMTGYYFKVL
jgi:hypothetical protein